MGSGWAHKNIQTILFSVVCIFVPHFVPHFVYGPCAWPSGVPILCCAPSPAARIRGMAPPDERSHVCHVRHEFGARPPRVEWGERPMWPSEPCARYAHAGNPATSREGSHNRMKNTRFCNIFVNHFASEDRCNGKTDVSPSPQWTLPVTTGDACPRGPSSSAFHPSQPATDARGAQAPAWRLADLQTWRPADLTTCRPAIC